MKKTTKPGDMFNRFQMKKKRIMSSGRTITLPKGELTMSASRTQTGIMNRFGTQGKGIYINKKKKTLRSPEAVVRDEQNSSHQFTKRKMTNIGITKRGGKKTNIGVMGQTAKQTEARKYKTKKKNLNSPENYGPAMKSAYEKKYGKVPGPKMDFIMPGKEKPFSIGKTAKTTKAYKKK